MFSLMVSPLALGEDSSVPPTKPALNLQVLESHRINLGNRALIFNRVVPPVLPPAAPTSLPSAEQLASAEAIAAQEETEKPSQMLVLSATVYDRQVTAIRWFHEGHEYQAFSNIDFNFVAGLGAFETAEAWYSVVLGLGNQTRAEAIADNQRAISQGWPASALKTVPSLSEFSSQRSEYRLVGGELPPPAAIQALDALHRYFDANKTSLITAYQQRLVEQAEREKYQREHPPVPQDTVINYWPKKSSVYLNAEGGESQP